MKKLLLSALILSTVSGAALAANPESFFAVPAKGKFLMRASTQWNWAQRDIDDDNSILVDGAYSFTNDLAIQVGYSNFDAGPARVWGRPGTSVSSIARQSPYVGLKYVPQIGPIKLSAELNYGMGFAADDGRSVDTRLGAGMEFGKVTIGGYYAYAYHFDFNSDVNIDRYTETHFGALAQVQATQKLSVELGYDHTWGDRFKAGGFKTQERNLGDTAYIGTTYEFRPNAYVTPFFKYTWLDQDYSNDKDVKAIGVKVAVVF